MLAVLPNPVSMQIPLGFGLVVLLQSGSKIRSHRVFFLLPVASGGAGQMPALPARSLPGVYSEPRRTSAVNEFTVPVPIIASVIAGAVSLLLPTASRAGIIERGDIFGERI